LKNIKKIFKGLHDHVYEPSLDVNLNFWLDNKKTITALLPHF